MAKLRGYNGVKGDGGIKRDQSRRMEICRRRMDVDD